MVRHLALPPDLMNSSSSTPMLRYPGTATSFSEPVLITTVLPSPVSKISVRFSGLTRY